MRDIERSTDDRILDILRAIDDINADIASVSKDSYLAPESGTIRRSVTWSLTVIGEAATKIIQDNRGIETSDPDLWQQLFDAKDQRNTMVHEYFKPDPELVWNEITRLLPSLKDAMQTWQQERRIITNQPTPSRAIKDSSKSNGIND